MASADWSRFRRYLEPEAVPTFVDPDDEPTVRLPVESTAEVMERPATRAAGAGQ